MRFTEQALEAYLPEKALNNLCSFHSLFKSYVPWTSPRKKVVCVHAYTWRKKSGITEEAIVLQWAVWTASWDFKPG